MSAQSIFQQMFNFYKEYHNSASIPTQNESPNNQPTIVSPRSISGIYPIETNLKRQFQISDIHCKFSTVGVKLKYKVWNWMPQKQ